MKKRLLALFLLVVIMLGITSCGKGSQESSQASSASDSQTSASDPAKMDQILLGVRLGMSPSEVEKTLGKESHQGEDHSLCFYDFTILDFRFDRLQYFFEDGKLSSIEYWLEGTGPGNTKIQTRDFSKNVAGVLGEPEESEVTLAWFQKWNLDEKTKISVGHNFGETTCIVTIQPSSEE